MSTTEDRHIANQFMMGDKTQGHGVNQGTLISVDTQGKLTGKFSLPSRARISQCCANVSWISKFGSTEKEWLFVSNLAYGIERRYLDKELAEKLDFKCEVVEVNQMWFTLLKK